MDLRETVIGPLALVLVLLGSGVGALLACVPVLAKLWVEVEAARAASALRRRLESPAAPNQPRRTTHIGPRRGGCHQPRHGNLQVRP